MPIKERRAPRAVADGLVRTDRARRPAVATDDGLSEFLRLERRSAADFYWVSHAGSEIRAGTSFADAEPLQPGFLEAMARAGGLGRGRIDHDQR